MTTGIERIAVTSEQTASNDIYVVNAPLRSGQPGDVLHGAGVTAPGVDGVNKSNLWAELEEKPAGTAPETASDVVSQPARDVGKDTWHHTPPGD